MDPDSVTHDAEFSDLLQSLAATPKVRPFRGTERYRVVRCLGEGGFGVVFEVEDRQLDRHVALKMLWPRTADPASSIRRLKAEFRCAADIVHPNLVALEELTCDDGRWFLVMELVRGRELLEFVRNRAEPRPEQGSRDSRQLLSIPRLRSVLRQVAMGAAALHERGLVHRDLKPSNVLVEDGGRAVVLDFGIAHAFTDEATPGGASHGLTPAGTPIYMAPEQFLGEPVGPSADVYALGVMLYEALTGRPPFEGEASALGVDKRSTPPTPPSELATVPADLEALCLEMLARDPEARPDTSAVVARLGNAPVRRPKPRPLETFVGRRESLDALRAALTEVERGPVVTFVHGSAGIGKSALLRAFVREARADHEVTVLLGQCHERESVPFRGLDRLVDSLCAYLHGLPRSEAAALMPRDVQLAVRLFPLLGEVPAAADVPVRAYPLAEPAALRERGFAAVKELLARIADKTRLVLVIDDLQWSDVDSARLLSWVLAPPDPPALLLVLVHRDDESPDASVISKTREAVARTGARIRSVSLGPLSNVEAVALAEQSLSGLEERTRLAQTIVARAEGHPLFIAELAADHRRNGSTIENAPALLEMIWQRVQRCSESARTLLETVALAGRPLEPALCFQASGLGGEGTMAMRTLCSDRLLRTTEAGGLGVFHDRVRDAIEAHANRSTRTTRHLALARTLAREPQTDLEAIARHYDAAERPLEAGDFALRAARRAREGFAFDRAAELFQFAIDRLSIEHTAGGELHEEMAGALTMAGSTARAGAAYLEAAARADAVADPWRAISLRRLGYEKASVAGDFELGTAGLQGMLDELGVRVPKSPRMRGFAFVTELARLRIRGLRYRPRSESEIDPAITTRIDVIQAAAHAFEFTDPTGGVILALRVARYALDAGEPRRIARALLSAAPLMLAMKKRRPVVFDRYLDLVESIGESLDDPSIIGEAIIRRGQGDLCFGEWRDARGHFAAAEALLERRGISDGEGLRYARGMGMQCAMFLGDLQGAYADGRRLLMSAVEREDPVAEQYVRTVVTVDEQLNADDLPRARALSEVKEFEVRCAVLLYRAEAKARVALYEGRAADAVEVWNRAWRGLRRAGWMQVPFVRVRAGYGRAMALMASGETRWPEIRRWAELTRSMASLHGAALGSAVEAARMLTVDNRAGAIAAFDRAAEQFSRASMRPLAAACRMRASQLAGDDAGVERAEQTLRSMGIARVDAWVDAWVPINRDARAVPKLAPAT